MLVNRSSLSRFAVPQTRAEWEQLFARRFAVLAKVPLSSWQFLVRILLVFALSLSLGRLFWLLLPMPVIPTASVAIATASGPSDANNGSVNIAQLKSFTLFGKVEAPKEEVPQPAVAMENTTVKTNLNLTLVGLMDSNSDTLARAIITSGDKQDLYAVNSALPVGNNVTLSKVMADRVIINNNGQYESLWLYQVDPNATPLIAPSPMQQTSPIPADMPAVRNAPVHGPEPRSQAESRSQPEPSRPTKQEHRVERTSDSVVAEASRNLADVVAMSAYSENGKLVGYKIRPGRDAEAFRAKGLQADDIVTAINGTPLSNPAKIMEIYKNMGNTTSASLEIRRGGSVITVNVELQ
jgi:general secretion pathway protein C